MPPGSRKQITYAHKRNRSKPSRTITDSSPLEEIDDPDHYMSHTELSRRLLKRARRSLSEGSSSKKLKSSALKSPPSQSAPSHEENSKLNSSRGIPANPARYSPIPLASRTASDNLKENFSARALKKRKLLDSPFNSRPNSSAPSPQKAPPLARPTEHYTQKSFRRTLSDTNYNPNISHGATTNNSPLSARSPARMRLPSAPSSPRPSKAANFGPLDFNFPIALGNLFSLPSTTNDIHLNLPPSSFSMYCGLESQFFDDAQGSSTPAKKKRAYTAIADDGEELQEPDLTITQDARDIDLVPSGMKVLPMRERSPWLSDSLISPPVSQEWKRPPQDNAYTHSPPKDVDTFDDISLGLGLAAKNRLLNSRTRSLDSPITSASANDKIRLKPNSRDRRGPLHASGFLKTTVAPPKRTRSGTALGPSVVIPSARILTASDHDDTGEVNEEPSRPPSPIVSDPVLTCDLPANSPDQLDAFSKGAGLMPPPVLQERKVGRKGKTKEVVMEDDDEDELLLKPGFNVWE
ncbi:hypothetical protein DFH09DRAFT_1504296 [Mycena vulgaris]|nr:hypothetical protein DFH09DRAFT_1504296 [Mycena vulgaris]